MDEQPESKSETTKLVDKKRIAICGGTLGRENRYYVRGQVVDVGITEEMRDDSRWDLLNGLFEGQEKEITPFLDYGLEPVRKPILVAEIWDESDTLIHQSPEIKGDEGGFFFHEFTKPLPPGKYIFQIHFRKLDSYRQFTKDIAYLNQKGKSEISGQSLIGKGKLRILPENFNGYVTTSDIDQTYLATDIHSNKGKLSTLFETPEQKLPLPGMPALYREIRMATEDSPLCFISASPHFFRRTLLSTIQSHSIVTESLHLKYLEGTIKGIVEKFWDSVTHPAKFITDGILGSMERIRKFAGASFQSLFDQMSYKLTILLRDRLYLPTNTKEILIGDNTESDYLIFILYQYILCGKMQGKELEDYLYRLNFLGRDAITRDAARTIRELGEENRNIHGDLNSVSLVLINKTAHGPDQEEMHWNIQSALPAGIDPFKQKEIHPYILTEGAPGFAVVLQDNGILDTSAVFRIVAEMAGEWMEGKVIDPTVLMEWIQNLTLPGDYQNEKDLILEGLKKALKKEEIS
ncbi:hypothetical protein LEP1GSC021_2055 [Leptospira noguchii str. 1993005606]|uniref:Phosphatidate phosphatase APP1 catalytic domain-containing protein n=2 Tax=Leptospira noguchii TaxID=28182 RepID=M6YYJ9_9LEPT|nr:phosphatase domain-containing protein [Leptospira noguchii]EMN01134.1 hypothetical protein LEP1GSC035_3946 [Leptospira noguchii str. 2007001578]EMO91403.1 hypothetical protein LEP1GSC024_3170 [Leptospira noguchii str. 2001034031]EPE83194.1 hypothetical protein LEP1GSC021_2055 [Leptospira noguchii str. 1993005606]